MTAAETSVVVSAGASGHTAPNTTLHGDVVRVGVLGGGQLGRMLALAGVPLGLRFVFFDPVAQSPAGHVGELIVGRYDDHGALDRFIETVDVVTYEFENVPTAAAEYVAARRPVWPPVGTLHVAQDRLREKEFFQSLGIATAPFAAADSRETLRAAIEQVGVPGIVKTRTMGYDGKGQYRVASMADADAAWDALAGEAGGASLIYEGFVTFDRELSILSARGQTGEIVHYPLVENVHHEGILRLSTAPAPAVDAALQQLAESYATRVLQELDYVGVLAIELFAAEGTLIANEMAPRVHNSGHWTIEGSETSQFENHVRAVCGLPLGNPAMVGYVAMLNLIGSAPPLPALLAIPDAHAHLYGKRAAPRRKVGHVTIRAASADVVRERVAMARRVLATSAVPASA